MSFPQRLWEPLKAPTVHLDSVYKRRRVITNPLESLEALLERGGHFPQHLTPQQEPTGTFHRTA